MNIVVVRRKDVLTQFTERKLRDVYGKKEGDE